MESNNHHQKGKVNLYMEANPNPDSLKFVANYMLVPEGTSYDFPDAESASEAPLAKELFKFDYVERVFYMSNFVTVTKRPDVEWVEVQDEIRHFIANFLQEDQPLLNAVRETTENIKEDTLTDIESKIKNILDEYVKPAVEMDGGAIQFHSFNSGVVKLLLQGACSGCPSSTITLKSGIENLLKSMVPEVEEVVAEGV